MGEVLAGLLLDDAGILIAGLDTSEITRIKMDFDVIGHYARPDIFSFEVAGPPETIVAK